VVLMSFLNFLDIKFFNKNIVILLAFGIILFLAIDLRIYNLNKVYTEYDDIGVLTFHKGNAGTREGNYDYTVLKKTISFSWETLRNLENSYLLPLYVAFGWTYSPGQYLLYPMILSDDDDYEMKVFKGRFVSVLSSVATLILLFWLFIKLNNGLNWAALFPVSIFVFSQNSILYAHHMSPYSTYCLSTVGGLFLIILAVEKKITTYTACLINTALLYFSYMNILIFMPLLWIEYHRGNLKTFIFSYFAEKKNLLFFNSLLIFPVLILFLLKMKQKGNFGTGRGVVIPNAEDFVSIISAPIYALKQLFIASQSLFMGFFPTGLPLVFAVFFLVVFVAVAYFGIFRIQVAYKVFFYALIIYLFQWLFLYTLSKLPLDQTRHALIFFPVLLSMVFVFFSYLKLPNLFYIVLCLTAVPFSYGEAKNLIDQKTSNFDFEFIEKQNVEHIFLYSFTESPLLYFEGEKTVLNVDVNAFKVAYVNSKMPETFLLVSQDQPLKSYKPGLQGRFPGMFSDYIIETLVEKSTGQYFPYNNYKVVSQQNGFYVYRFSRIN